MPLPANTAKAPIVPPYDRAPQLTGRYTKPIVPGSFDALVEADFTRFVSDASLTMIVAVSILI